MKKAIGYVRVSTQKQVQEGVSIDAQIAKIKAWAEYNEYQLINIYIDEGISGKRMDNRPELNAALDALEKDMAFVFYSMSRVSRNTIETILMGKRINDCGADMVSLNEKIDTTTPAGRMIFNVFAVLNEFERDQVSERTRMALAYLKQNNKAYSPTPYGLDREGDDLIPNDIELEQINVILDLKEKGYGHRKIASTLNRHNIQSKNGGIWYAKTVRQLIERVKPELNMPQKN